MGKRYETDKLPNIMKRKERLMAELDFAQQLAKRNKGGWEELVSRAESMVAEAEQEGMLTDRLVEEVEQLLSPMQKAAKEYKIICPAHAHIDMNWMWSFDVTVMTVLDTFRTMLDILKEYPEYKFSQSQASVYRIVEQYAPKLLAPIRRYIKEGRWEVTASTWVEADKNMPVGESFARHALYTKSYLADLLDLDPDTLNIDFEPDTFGHSRNVPEIDIRSGVKYYYHCRGNDGGHYLYRWRSPSGAELIVYRDPYFYNAYVDSRIAADAPEIADRTGLKTLLRVYGVGDHGGGPTRRDVEKLLDMAGWPIFPQIRLGTFGEYFAEAEKIRGSLPVEDAEINFICDGCYSSQSRIKTGNIRSERGLLEAEAISALAFLAAGGEKKDYRASWEKVLFCQFHDILTGSGIIATREYACGRYQEVEAEIRSGRKEALLTIADQIDTSMLEVSGKAGYSFGAGAGHFQPESGNGTSRIYHLFNGSAVGFCGEAEVWVWDYGEDIERLGFADTKGRELISQLLDQGHYWGHNFHKFVVQTEVPAFGYETIVTIQKPLERGFAEGWQQRRQHEEKFVLENDFLKATVDHKSGAVISLTDKSTGREKLDQGRGGARLCVIDEAAAKPITDWNGGMSSWFVGRHKDVEFMEGNVEITPGAFGALRNSFRIKGQLRDSRFEMEIGLDRDSRELDFAVHCDWREFGETGVKIPSLAYMVALAEKTGGFIYDVPFGVLERKPMDIDRPANSFVAADTGVMVMSEARYGFRCVDDSICLKLLRSSTDPDPVPEICHHDIAFALSLPKDMGREALLKKSQAKYVAVQVVSGKRHKGILPAAGKLFIHEGTAVLSALKSAEYVKGGLALRCYEVLGQASREKFTFVKNVKKAYTVDTTERKVITKLTTEGGSVILENRPYQVQTVIVEF